MKTTILKYIALQAILTHSEIRFYRLVAQDWRAMERQRGTLGTLIYWAHWCRASHSNTIKLARLGLGQAQNTPAYRKWLLTHYAYAFRKDFKGIATAITRIRNLDADLLE